VGAMRFELITLGFGGQWRRSVAIRAGAKYVIFIGFLAMFLTDRAAMPLEIRNQKIGDHLALVLA
jgi:hypothetical protein